MKTKLIPLICMLVAGLSALLICIMYNRTLLDMMIIVLITMLIFFIIGYVAEVIFENFLVVKKDDGPEIENMDDESEETENIGDVENINIDMDEMEDNEGE